VRLWLCGFAVGQLLLCFPAAANDDLIGTARAHEANEDFVLANDFYQQAVDAFVVDKAEGSVEMLTALLEQSRVQIKIGKTETAEDTLRYAQSIVRRNEGVYSEKQLEIISRLADIAFNAGDAGSANDLHRFSFLLKRNHAGDNPDALLPAHRSLADWYMDTGQYYMARNELVEAASLIELTDGEHDPRLIELQLAIAKTRRLQKISRSDKSLHEALEVVQANPDLAEDVKSSVYLELGDTYTAKRKDKRAASYYEKVAITSPPRMISMAGYAKYRRARADFLVANPGRQYKHRVLDVRTDAELSKAGWRTQRVVGSPLQFSLGQLRYISPGVRDRRYLPMISVTMAFSVDREGRVKNVDIIDSNAPRNLNLILKRSAAKLRYRPALVEGVPVDTERVTLTQTFKTPESIAGITP
jgi:tetratricopeptide (TPR) repeat protein